MRPIKFRAWVEAENNHGMHYPTCIQLDAIGHIDKLWTNTHKLSCDIDEMTLMQFTGLLDKNDKEIYEGDIVREGEGKYCVEFKNGMFGIQFNYYGFLPFMKSFHFETIGNIYENPELLK